MDQVLNCGPHCKRVGAVSQGSRTDHEGGTSDTSLPLRCLQCGSSKMVKTTTDFKERHYITHGNVHVQMHLPKPVMLGRYEESVRASARTGMYNWKGSLGENHHEVDMSSFLLKPSALPFYFALFALW